MTRDGHDGEVIVSSEPKVVNGTMPEVMECEISSSDFLTAKSQSRFKFPEKTLLVCHSTKIHDLRPCTHKDPEASQRPSGVSGSFA